MLKKLFAVAGEEERIKELEARVADLEKKLFSQVKKNQLMRFRIDLFKGFSPKLWFEYFSPDAGQFSHSAKANKNYEQWLDREKKRLAAHG